jgi:hypothetical protein
MNTHEIVSSAVPLALFSLFAALPFCVLCDLLFNLNTFRVAHSFR